MKSTLMVTPSQCLKLRFNKSVCDLCLKACAHRAIDISDTLRVDRKLCKECMLCAAVCPTFALEVDLEKFYTLLSRLKRVESPVLGCFKSEVKAHERTFCLGFLSEELLIALSVFLDKELVLNLTLCKDCENSFIVENLKNFKEKVEKKLGEELLKVKLVEEKEELNFEEVNYDRRKFISEFAWYTKEVAREVNETLNEDERKIPFYEKHLPVKREVLNQVVTYLASKEGNVELIDAIFKNYYFDAKVNDRCNLCFACVGGCPSGALSENEIEEIDFGDPTGESFSDELLFNSSLCSGCRLCESFCRMKAISVSQGYSGKNPFKAICINKNKVLSEGY